MRRPCSVDVEPSTAGGQADVSAAVNASQRNGYIHNTTLNQQVDDRESLSGRLRMRYRPAPDLELALQPKLLRALERSEVQRVGGDRPLRVDVRILAATRRDLDRWMITLPQPWTAAMEATMFKGWVYDHVRPHAADVPVLTKCESTPSTKWLGAQRSGFSARPPPAGAKPG